MQDYGLSLVQWAPKSVLQIDLPQLDKQHVDQVFCKQQLFIKEGLKYGHITNREWSFPVIYRLQGVSVE